MYEAPFDHRVTFTFTCRLCSKEESVSYVIAKYAPMMYARKPEWWNVLNSSLICNDHKIEIEDAG